MKIFKFLVLAMLGMVATSSFANTNTTQVANPNATWNYVGVINNESRFSFNPLSVHTVQTMFGNQYYQAWFKREIINDIDPLDNVSVGDYSLDLWRVDCNVYQLRMIKSLNYKKDGIFVNETRLPYTSMKDIAPSTTGQAIVTNVCTVANTLPSTTVSSN